MRASSAACGRRRRARRHAREEATAAGGRPRSAPRGRAARAARATASSLVAPDERSRVASPATRSSRVAHPGGSATLAGARSSARRINCAHRQPLGGGALPSVLTRETTRELLDYARREDVRHVHELHGGFGRRPRPRPPTCSWRRATTSPVVRPRCCVHHRLHAPGFQKRGFALREEARRCCPRFAATGACCRVSLPCCLPWRQRSRRRR